MSIKDVSVMFVLRARLIRTLLRVPLVSVRINRVPLYVSLTCTVPCKCKLTVPRNSNFATRSSILETRKLRVSRLESSASSIESSASSFEAGKQRTSRVISFSHILSEATVQFFFTGTNSARRPTVFAFLLERCAHVYARAGKS